MSAKSVFETVYNEVWSVDESGLCQDGVNKIEPCELLAFQNWLASEIKRIDDCKQDSAEIGR